MKRFFNKFWATTNPELITKQIFTKLSDEIFQFKQIKLGVPFTSHVLHCTYIMWMTLYE